MINSNFSDADPENIDPIENTPPQLETPRFPTAPPKTIRRPYFLGAATGFALPLVFIIIKIFGCRYGLNQIGDIVSAFGWCALPPALAGAVITIGASSIGRAAGQRADVRLGSNHHTIRDERIGLWIGLLISFVIGAIPALMVLFPDC